MHTPKTLLFAALTALTFTYHAAAQNPDPFGGSLYPPDFIMGNADAIGLTPEQRNAIRDIVQQAQTRFGEMQQQLKQEVDALGKAAEPVTADQAAVLAQFDKVADKEKEIKRYQLTMLMDLRKKLTDDQRAKLVEMRAKMTPPASLREKSDRVRAAAQKWQSEGRDLAPVGEILKQIDPLMRTQKFAEAEALLDKALQMLGGGK
jgi:Spy/CpxP family protein refolding chaperone